MIQTLGEPDTSCGIFWSQCRDQAKTLQKGRSFRTETSKKPGLLRTVFADIDSLSALPKREHSIHLGLATDNQWGSFV